MNIRIAPSILSANFAALGEDIPQNLPKQSGNCPALSDSVNDVIDVKLKIKVPNNAKGLSLDFDFWSGEWPEFVCSPYNDAFVRGIAYEHGPDDPFASCLGTFMLGAHPSGTAFERLVPEGGKEQS